MFQRHRDLACQQAVELVTDYIEDVLSRSDRRRLESHLAGCPTCTEYLVQMRTTIELMGRIEPEELPAEMRDELIALYGRWVLDSG
jgi:anti-sigma factor RsiW